MEQPKKKLKAESEDSAASSTSSATRRFHVLVGCTGSVASIKVPLLVRELSTHEQLQVSVVATENACHFFKPSSDLPVSVQVYRDADEWKAWKTREDPVLHIELRRQADLLVIAPLDANTLAKVANGICDNLLVCNLNNCEEKKYHMYRASLGFSKASAYLPSHEHPHVGSSHHCWSDRYTEGLRLSGGAMYREDTSLRRYRKRRHGRGINHCPRGTQGTEPRQVASSGHTNRPLQKASYKS
ncbi:uncharacterized protein [Asterias amurensis]|uniref:uncharacterized protein isoform X1 n=1 Tax=Asterias amurensis TaxID=7602 RepID=UPI003AB2C2AF